jgi:hypothetical protein
LHLPVSTVRRRIEEEGVAKTAEAELERLNALFCLPWFGAAMSRTGTVEAPEQEQNDSTRAKIDINKVENCEAPSALVKELVDIEADPNSTAAEQVTVAVRLAMHALGGRDVDADAHLSHTCQLETGSGRPASLSVEDTVALKSACEEPMASNEAAVGSGGNGDGTMAAQRPPDVVGEVCGAFGEEGTCTRSGEWPTRTSLWNRASARRKTTRTSTPQLRHQTASVLTRSKQPNAARIEPT